MIRVAINGFGRIGRQIIRAGYDDPDIEWVAVNDLSSIEDLAYLLKYDSCYGKFPVDVTAKGDTLHIGKKTIKVLAERDPEKLPWKKLNIDVVIEATGFFTKHEGASKHLKAGAKKVLISAPSKDADFDLVMGVNEHDYDKKKHHIVSNCSCTTNAVAPLAKVLHDNYGIEKGFLITAHAYTATQNLIDSPHKKDPRRGRNAATNIVPTSTGAAKSVAKVIPALAGILDGYAWRVPVPVGSIVSLICHVKKDVTPEEVNWLFKQVAEHHLTGILEYNEDPLVLKDIVGNPHSSVFDAKSTKVIDRLVTISAWYDNEAGFSHRMVEVVKLL
jgi:glyceraldehyde 3-phosphate dehydrogenase